MIFAKRAGDDLVIAKTGGCTLVAGNRLDESQIATDTSDLAVLVWVLVLVAGQTTSERLGGEREAAVVAEATYCLLVPATYIEVHHVAFAGIVIAAAAVEHVSIVSVSHGCSCYFCLVLFCFAKLMLQL